MTREEAIEILWQYDVNFEPHPAEKVMHAIDMAIEALSEETSTINENHQLSEETPTDLISRADAIEAVAQQWLFEASAVSPYVNDDDINEYRKLAEELFEDVPSADAVQGWRKGKPTKRGEYTVTVKSMRGGMVESLYYGKPMMPNRKVKGMCWYRSDDEWGDVVYDDADILAWMPLPKPYKGGAE